MIEHGQLAQIVAKARLAPSVHNTQPARWRLGDWAVEIWCDRSVQLQAADPDGQDALLSCGAATEATRLVMEAEGAGIDVEDISDGAPEGDLAPFARLNMRGAGRSDPLVDMLEQRFTHRGSFGPKRMADWARSDMILISDTATKAWLGRLNDWVSMDALRDDGFRAELLDWMRLDPSHPRVDLDGMSAAALRLSPLAARFAARAFGPWWGPLDRARVTTRLLAEAKHTQSAAAIACFHAAVDQSPIETGARYLRLWLEVTARGMAGWPMAALTSDAGSRAAICDRLGLGEDRQLVQVIRFGQATQDPAPRARRVVDDLIV